MQESASILSRLKPVLQELHDNTYPHIPNPPLCKKRASVALVLRIRPTAPDLGSWSHPEKSVPFSDSLDRFFNQDWVKSGDAEILFIKRAAHAGDRWGGHIAFPGGKKEPSDVDDQAAAVRETREEVGLDLETQHCLFIGKLPERVITTNWGKVPIMVLCPYVYLLLRHDIPPLALQPTEVHSTHWVSIRGLLSFALRTTVTADISDRLKKQRGPSMKRFVRAALGQFVFSATVLAPSESLFCTSVPGFIPKDNQPPKMNKLGTVAFRSLIYSDRARQVAGPHILWGLTLGIIAELLNGIDSEATRTLCSWPTFSHWDIRLILWVLTYRLRTNHEKSFNQPGDANDSKDEAVSVNGVDDTTFATSMRKPGLAAAHFPDEYFRLMRKAVVSTVVIRANIAAVLALAAFLWLRRHGSKPVQLKLNSSRSK